MIRSQSARSSSRVVDEIRFHAASRSAAASLPLSTARPSEPSTRDSPFFASSSLTSRTTVSYPDLAHTSAIPEPMRPAPRTPTLRIAIVLLDLLRFFDHFRHGLRPPPNPVAHRLAAEAPQRDRAVEVRADQREQRRLRRDHDPAPVQPELDGLAAEPALVERREHRVQIAGPPGTQV